MMQRIMGKILKQPGARLRSVSLKLQIRFVAKESTQKSKAGSVKRDGTNGRKKNEERKLRKLQKFIQN